MGLFSKPEPLDASLASITIGYTDPYERGSLKHVAKHQAALLGALERGETPQLVAVHAAGLRSHLVMFTDRRLIEFYGREVGKVIPYHDVAQAKPMDDPQGGGGLLFLGVASNTALLDFASNDPKREDHIIYAPAKTPRQQLQMRQLATSANGG
jgi:hypothetical protein